MAERILGTLRAVGGEGGVRMEARFEVGVQELWSAVTDPRRLAAWWGRVDGDLRVGGEFRAHIADAGDFMGRSTRASPSPGAGDDARCRSEARSAGWPPTGPGSKIQVEHLADRVARSDLRDAEARWGRLLPAYGALAAGVGPTRPGPVTERSRHPFGV
jgi:hypothetical protein